MSALHKFVTYLLTYTLIHLLTDPDPHVADINMNTGSYNLLLHVNTYMHVFMNVCLL